MSPPDGTAPPQPPFRLANRVCALEGRGDPALAYDMLGSDAKRELLDLLPAGWTFAGKRVLDFGCGAGRTLRHFLAEAQDAEIWGTDIDEESIGWCSSNLSPPLHFTHNRADPPLGLEYGSFDLIWALSVFTHLTDTSFPWLLELHRLLRPGGFLIGTYMGRWNGHELTGEPWEEDRVGMNVLRTDQGWEHGGPMVLMSDWWVREHWGRAFEFVAHADVHGQTWVLLRKRDRRLTVADLARPGDDPRELEALRHNIRQVEADRRRSLDELRQYYEGSLSWRITRPLRSASGRVRRLRGLRRR